MSHHWRAIILPLSLLACGIVTQAATTYWAGTNNGLLKSSDGGVTWPLVKVTTSNSFLSGTLGIDAIALDPQQPANVYFVANTSGGGNGFFRSNDNGATWTGVTLLGIVMGANNTWLAVDPVFTNIIYLGAAGQLHKSTDFGNTWAQVAVPAGVSGLTIDPSASGALYISNANIVYKSTDYGTTWTKLPAVAQPTQGYFAGSVTVDPNNSNTLYVEDGYPYVNGSCGTITQNTDCGLFKSTDGGQTWKNVAPAGVYINVAFDARNGAIYASGAVTGLGHAVLDSTDGGNSWNPLSNKLDGFLVADPSVSGLLIAFQAYPSEAEIFRSTDGGGTWTQISLPTVTPGISQFPNVQCMAVARPLGVVSSTVFRSGPVAPESIVSALGSDLAIQPVIASPPALNVGGTTVNVIDSTGTSRPALIFYASSIEVNFEIPAGTALGTAMVVITSGDGTVWRTAAGIATVAPGFYQLNSSGLAAAYVLRATGTVHTYQNVYQLDNSNNIIPLPIDLSPSTDQIYLELYGTGIRGGSNPTATLGNVTLPVLYAGAQGQYPGEDQVDVGPIPTSLAGAGNLPLVFSINGIPANTINVSIK